MEQIWKSRQFVGTHRKKLAIFVSTLTGLYFLHFILKKWWRKRKDDKNSDEKNLAKAPAGKVAEIEDLLDELPQPSADKLCVDKTISLKDLLGELSEFSDDEEWRELIKSVQKFYDEGSNNE